MEYFTVAARRRDNCGAWWTIGVLSTHKSPQAAEGRRSRADKTLSAFKDELGRRVLKCVTLKHATKQFPFHGTVYTEQDV